MTTIQGEPLMRRGWYRTEISSTNNVEVTVIACTHADPLPTSSIQRLCMHTEDGRSTGGSGAVAKAGVGESPNQG